MQAVIQSTVSSLNRLKCGIRKWPRRCRILSLKSVDQTIWLGRWVVRHRHDSDVCSLLTSDTVHGTDAVPQRRSEVYQAFRQAAAAIDPALVVRRDPIIPVLVLLTHPLGFKSVESLIVWATNSSKSAFVYTMSQELGGLFYTLGLSDVKLLLDLSITWSDSFTYWEQSRDRCSWFRTGLSPCCVGEPITSCFRNYTVSNRWLVKANMRNHFTFYLFLYITTAAEWTGWCDTCLVSPAVRVVAAARAVAAALQCICSSSSTYATHSRISRLIRLHCIIRHWVDSSSYNTVYVDESTHWRMQWYTQMSRLIYVLCSIYAIESTHWRMY